MRTFVLVKTTLQEMIHEKLFVIVLVMSVLILVFSLVLGTLSFSEQQKILADFGLLSIELACLVISTFSGSYMIAREIEKQTCLLMLSRPISRSQFILAKFLGVTVLNIVIVLILSILLGALMQIWHHPGQLLNLVVISSSILMKVSVLLGVAFVFSQIVRPVIALMFTLVVYLLGHWIVDLKFFAEKFHDDFAKGLVTFFDWVSPNFYRMNWKSYAYLEKGPGSLEVLWMFMHSLGWILVLVFLMQILFRRKDIV